MSEVGEIIITLDNRDLFADALRRGILEGLEEVGIDAQKIASQNAPYDTGRLSGSIAYVVDEGEPSVMIGTNVEYAPYQELGTSRYVGANGGKGYLRPTVQENKARFKAIMERRLKNC